MSHIAILRIRNRWQLVRRGSLGIVHNGLLRTFLTGLGLWGSAFGVFSSALGTLPSWIWITLLGGVAGASIVISRPRHRLHMTFDGGPWSVEFVRGDLFNVTEDIIVTVDRNASLGLADVGEASLAGQLLSRWFATDSRDLVHAASGAWDASLAEAPLGTMIRFQSAEVQRAGWLFCLAHNARKVGVTSWNDLSLGYDALWRQLRTKNCHAIAIPVIGAGFARTQMPYRGILAFLALSWHAANLDGLVVGRLKVVIGAQDFDPRALQLVEELLEALGYHEDES